MGCSFHSGERSYRVLEIAGTMSLLIFSTDPASPEIVIR